MKYTKVAEYHHEGYILRWQGGRETDIGEWVITDSNGNELVHATTNGVPPTKKQAEILIEGVIQALKNMLDYAFIYGLPEKKSIEGNLLDLEIIKEWEG